MVPVVVALVGTACLAGASLYNEWSARRALRASTYERAAARARETGKPLLVIGDPGGGLTHNDYGYGDICGDLTGCPDAPLGGGMVLDLSSLPLPFETDSCVVYCCYVLELVHNAPDAAGELLRVAGRSEDLFVLALQASEVAQHVYPGTKWNCTEAPNGGSNERFSMTPIERRAIVAARARLR